MVVANHSLTSGTDQVCASLTEPTLTAPSDSRALRQESGEARGHLRAHEGAVQLGVEAALRATSVVVRAALDQMWPSSSTRI